MKAVSGLDEEGAPRNGPFRQSFKDGTTSCEGHFINGLKHGRWVYYLANGQPKAIGHYRGDVIIGEWQWYRENGQLMQTGSFSENGDKHGLWSRYHPNGALMDEGCYERGRKTGVWTLRDAGGGPPRSRHHAPPKVFQPAGLASRDH